MKVSLDSEKVRFLEKMAADVLEESRVRPGQKIGSFGPNLTGGTLIRPGGRDVYPAFWVRDFAMSLEGGVVTKTELRHALFMTALSQHLGDDWHTPSGSLAPKGAIVDHLSFDGRPVFFPGTIDDYENQGGYWGYLPSLDDHYYFAHMAWHYFKVTGQTHFLKNPMGDVPIIERLEMAFDVPPSRPETELVWCDSQNRGVSFGFVDTVIHTGELLFCSLLKLQAARRIAEMEKALERSVQAEKYRRIVETLKKSIPQTFMTKDGFLKASTGISSQPDVWGTAFAVYIDALNEEGKFTACRALEKGYADGTIAWKGNIRHVPTSHDFSEESAWEKLGGDYGKKKSYQNGAYWGTPAGWVLFAIAQVDSELAKNLFDEYVEELQEGDFRKGPDFGSPWECMHPEGDFRQNSVYLTSVACPLGAVKRLTAKEV